LHPDVRRVETPSALGNWSYEVIDTKLAREAKAGAVLQLCLYSDLLCAVQGTPPEYMHVVAPWSDFEPQSFRYADFAAYFRKAQRGLRDHLVQGQTPATYPDPKEHCEICRWRGTCDQRRRDDDHRCVVAGILKSQINELRQRGVTTLTALSQLALPLAWKPERGSKNAYEPAALKRLMGRYATREEEMDRMLRAHLFVDLYGVVRQGLRASVESYSIKKLESFYGFTRTVELQDANKALRSFEEALELEDVSSIPEETKAVVRAYNQDDYASASALRDWLEALRAQLIAASTEVPRPESGDAAPSEDLSEWLIKIRALIDQLTADVPVDPEERTEFAPAMRDHFGTPRQPLCQASCRLHLVGL